MMNNLSQEKTYSKMSLLIAIVSFPVSFFYFYLLRYLLPNNFFFDTGTIRRFMKPGAIVNDYSIAGKFYRQLGFKYDTPIFYEIVLASTVFFIFTCALLYILKIDFLHFDTSLMYVFSLALFGPFFAMISKDLIVFIFLLATFLFFNRKSYRLYFLLFILLYAVQYRKYWFITIVLLFSLCIVRYFFSRHTIIISTLFTFIYLVLVSICYHLLSGSYISIQRMSVNSTRVGSDYARTATRTILPPTNLFNDLTNTIYNAINLLIPIDGIGSINELAYYLWLYFILYIIYRTYKTCHGISGNTRFYLLFFISFIFTQSLFEPDMGSAFRHQLPVTLFIPFMLQSYQQNYFEETSHIDLKNDKITK